MWIKSMFAITWILDSGNYVITERDVGDGPIKLLNKRGR
jgi:hypothetical protein